MPLAEKIRKLRMKHDLSLSDVAQVVGVQKSTVQRWEKNGIKSIKQDKLVLLAKALRTSVAYLTDQTKDASAPPGIPYEDAQFLRHATTRLAVRVMLHLNGYEFVTEDGVDLACKDGACIRLTPKSEKMIARKLQEYTDFIVGPLLEAYQQDEENMA
jgi:transcriptional regulator with XRE-family HTH domain